jgi:hypothetical protein
MRQTYSLSDQTRLVLTGHVKPIAFELDKTPSYIYAILADTEPDRFAQFMHLYAACVRAGAPVGHWDNWFEAVKAKYTKVRPDQTAIECLAEKIKSDADTTAKLVDALQDGKIDEREGVEIQGAIDKERETLDRLETHLRRGQSVNVA